MIHARNAQFASTFGILKILKKLIIPIFRSEEGKNAWFFLILLVVLLFCVSGINVFLSYLGRDFITALNDKKTSEFYAICPRYLLAFGFATLIAVYYRYTEERLVLVWRNWMTQHLLKKYFFSRAYYKLRMNRSIDNPDQRIAEDVKNFTATTLSLILIILNSTITVFAFIGVLISISYSLVAVLIGYALVGTIGTAVIGKRLVRIYNKQYQREANFRYSLVRVRDNAESVAFFRGEARERLDLAGKFKSIFRNTTNLIGWNRNLGFFTTSYNYFALIVPTLLVAPLYFKGQVHFGVITQAAGAFGQVLAALSVIIVQFERISAFTAALYRLSGLWDVLNARDLADDDDDPEVQVEEGAELKLTDLTVQPPQSQRELVKNLSFTLKRGSAILIMGESGSGKSSILRTIAGLWNTGSGGIQRPRLRELMFLPQKPYMPLGSLRTQLMYPSRESSDSDEKLIEILKEVNLEIILSRVDGDMSRKLDWANVLSLGEQQRVSFARLLFNCPKLAFLDEASSALDEPNEEILYTLLRKRGISFVSVGHRSSLIKYHDYLLSLEGEGEWTIKPIDSSNESKGRK